jgi:hypothetical protein
LSHWSHDEPTVQRAVALILDGRAEQVYGWLAAAPETGADGRAIVFLKDVFLILVQRHGHDAILAAALKAPARELFAIIPTYFAACVLLERRRFDEGFALLQAFRNRCFQNLQRLPTADSDGFMVLFRHAVLTNDHRYLDDPYYRTHLAANQARLDTLQWATPAGDRLPGDGPVVMVSCDQRYAEVFLPRFFDSLARFGAGWPVHVHLLDPEGDPHATVQAAAPAGQAVAVSWEASGALKCSAYYASARFVRMAALLAHYQRPIRLFDVDAALCQPITRLEPAMADADFGCFRMPRLDPGSVYQASVTAFQPSPAGLELADLLGRLILSKMSLLRPLLWLIDQASLYSAITMLADREGRLRVADFTQRLGLPLSAFIETGGDAETKLALMKRASGAAD